MVIDLETSLENTAPALTNWKNPPSLSALKADLEEAKSSRDAQVSQISEWLDNLHIRGKAKIKTAKGSSSIQPKLIRKQAEWRYAPLGDPFLSTEDLFRVKPVTWEDRKAAQQNQLVLNHQFNNQLDKVHFIDEYIRAAVDEGTVIVRVGWESQEEEYLEDEPQVQFQQDPSFGPTLEQVAQLKQNSPSQFMTDVPNELKQALELSKEHGFPLRPIVTGTLQVKKTRFLKNQPTVEVCDYRNVTIDPTCKGNIKKANFIIYSFTSSISELKKDGKYKNLDRINLGTESVLGQPDHSEPLTSANFNFKDDPRKKFVVHEYWGKWDIDGTGVTKTFVAAWAGSTLIRLEESPYPDKELPFVVVPYLPVRGSVYGEPDGALLEDNQKVVGAVTRGMIDIMGKSANGQTGMRKDMLDATNKRKFEQGMDYEFNMNVDPRQGVFMHTYPEIPASAQFMLQLQNMEAESLTGVKSFSQGISGQVLGDVAVGVRGALDAASKRELAILKRLANGVVEIGKKIVAMNGVFLSEEEVVRITNEEFVTVKREDLAGNFDLKTSISTAEEDNNKAQELAFMLQTMGNNMDPEMSKMILSDIARLRKMPELAKKIEEYQPQPNPLAQKKMELEVALLEAQVMNERAKSQQATSTAALNEAKISTEQAKQGNLQSATDKNNLDFVEQESGVTQERNLQRQGEQARSQLALKRMGHEFKKEEQKLDLLKEYVSNRSR